MWKFTALVIAASLLAPLSANAQEAIPEATKKQMEVIVAARASITKKIEEYRKTLSPPAIPARYTALQATYQAVRANLNKKLDAENAKTPRDAAAADAITAKIQKMDDVMGRNLARAWNTYNVTMNEHAYFYNFFGTLETTGVYSDSWMRCDLDMQVLVALVASVETRIDLAKTQVTNAVAAMTKAFDEADAVCKE